LGLAGQPRLQKYIRTELNEKFGLRRSATGLIASSCVSPIYVVTNPLSGLEVIMQTSSIQNKGITVVKAVKDLVNPANPVQLPLFLQSDPNSLATSYIASIVTKLIHGYNTALAIPLFFCLM
jgi:hypothetical protein